MTPTTEVCDSVDNNCDGVVDENFDLLNDPNNCGACGLECHWSTPICSDGVCGVF